MKNLPGPLAVLLLLVLLSWLLLRGIDTTAPAFFATLKAIDDYALPLPSSRAKLVFGPARDGATSTCDLILDLSGGTPLFPAHSMK